MVLGVALLIVVITAAPAISATNALPNQGSINSFSPFSSAATSQPLINSSFIPFPTVQFVTPLNPATQVILIPQPVPTNIGTLQPSIGTPSIFLGSFTLPIGTPVTILGTFQPSIGLPIASLGSFAPSSGVPLVILGSFQPSIGAQQPSVTSTSPVVVPILVTPFPMTPAIPVAVTTTGITNVPVSVVNAPVIPVTVTGISLALTNGQLGIVDPADPSSAPAVHILNPEPSSFWLFGTTLGGLALLRWWSLQKPRITK